MNIIFDEDTGLWEMKKEPYATVEIATEKDYKQFCEMTKRNLAKKPLIIVGKDKNGENIRCCVCPICETSLIGRRVLQENKKTPEFWAYMPKYCTCCGQKLDWSELE